MNAIRLIAVDMDGTLLNNKKEMPVGFIPWVKAHPEILMVVASGRQYETLRLDMEEIQDSLYFLADNGAFVYYRGEMLFADAIDQSVFYEALQLVDGMPGVVPILCGANRRICVTARRMRNTMPICTIKS